MFGAHLDGPLGQRALLLNEAVEFGGLANGVVNDEVGAFDGDGQVGVGPDAVKANGVLQREARKECGPGDANLSTTY